MKKSLVLAMAMALGVTASAYAANPFSDVPAGHWAYDSIDKLAAAGVIDGMGDGTFQGARNMTRYEMAQIVAKAMAKGANVDKLAAEFADELDNLGVRVAKLEKKSDNVTITGQIRYEYAHRSSDLISAGGAHSWVYDKDTNTWKDKVSKDKKMSSLAQNRLRTRLFVNGQINEDWAYHARLQNDAKINNGSADNNFDLNQAYVTGRVGGLKVTAGKAPQVIADGNFYDDTMEMVKVEYGKAVKLSAFYANADAKDEADVDVSGVAVSTKLGKAAKVNVEYVTIKDEGEDKYHMYDATLKFNLGKNIVADYTYMNTNVKGEAHSNGTVIGLAYKGANAKKVGSWGIWGKHYDQADATMWAHTMKTGDWDNLSGIKGWGTGITYTVAKNMVYMVDYYDLHAKSPAQEKSHVIWNRLQMTF